MSEGLPADTATLTEQLRATAVEYNKGAPYGQPLVVGLIREAAAALSSLETRLEEAQRTRDALTECQAQRQALRREVAQWQESSRIRYDRAEAAEAREKALREAIEVAQAALANQGWMGSGEQDRRDYVRHPLRAALVGVRGEEKGLQAGDESEIRRGGGES